MNLTSFINQVQTTITLKSPGTFSQTLPLLRKDYDACRRKHTNQVGSHSCILLLLLSFTAIAKCKNGCLALASYYVWDGSNLTYISYIFGQQTPDILKYNPQAHNPDALLTGTRINIPFSCECLNSNFLGHTFSYLTQHSDTYTKVSQIAFANLTTEEWVQRVNIYTPTQIPDKVTINVTVNYSCGDAKVSKDYGFFVTYPLRLGDSLSSVAVESGVPARLLEMYNKGSDFGSGNGLVFEPARDQNGTFPPYKSRTAGISRGATIGICVGGASAALALASFLSVNN